jgi:uncharacterized protein
MADNVQESLSSEDIYRLGKQGRWNFILPMFEINPYLGAVASRYVKETSGWTLLHQAAYFGEFDAVKRLMTLGADPSIKGKDGKTAAEVAMERDHKSLHNFIENRTCGGLWEPVRDPRIWPSSNKFRDGKITKKICESTRIVGYGGGEVVLRPGQTYYVDDLDRVIVGWHGSTDPPCGMDGDPMI